MAELARLVPGELQHALGAGGEGDLHGDEARTAAGLVGGDGLDDRLDRLGRGLFLGSVVSATVSTTVSIVSAAKASSIASSSATVSIDASILSAAKASSIASSSATVSTTSSTSAAASCWRTWANAEASVLSIPPSGSWTASDIE